VELAAFFIVSEALANVAKHARATSATVELEKIPGLLVVQITDDGVGGASADAGTGLRGLADRVETLGGRLRVWSPPGQGTRVRAELPCE
jgi:signal transduction histidine kinase